MNIMILDGNSIVNRAFYGVRPLTAPDGPVFLINNQLASYVDKNKP